MGLFKKFKEALPAIAGVAGFAIGGPAGAAIGSGLGSLAAGKSVNDALVNAAMGYGVGSMGQAAGFGKGMGTGPGKFLPSYTSKGTQTSMFGLGDTSRNVVNTIGGGMPEGTGSTGLGSLFDSDMLKYGALGAGALGLAGGLGPEEETSSGSFYNDSYEGQARGKVVGPTSQTEYNINSPEEMAKYNQEVRNLQKYDRTRAAGGEYDPIVGYAAGGEHNGPGEVAGPGTGTSDSVPARLSDGEFVLTAKAVRGAGGGDRDIGAARIYDMMADLEATA
tara:strand:+ start:196 stop:1026 length:831 start_codon:yes stop_codon:yes gene_type:complete